jgi:hypothetical protein
MKQRKTQVVNKLSQLDPYQAAILLRLWVYLSRR